MLRRVDGHHPAPASSPTRDTGSCTANTASGTRPFVLIPGPAAAAQDARPAGRARSPSAATASSRSTCSATATRTARRHVALLDAAARRAGRRRCSTTSSSTRPWSAARRWARTSRSRRASLAPERLRGTVIEMPVLDNALLGCALAFTPLLVYLTVRRAADRARRERVRARCCRARPSHSPTSALDWVGQDPEPVAARTCRACSSAASAPPRSERAQFETPRARDRPPARPGPPVLRRRHARRELRQRAPDRGELDPRAAPRPERLTGEIAALPRRVLARARVGLVAAGAAGGRAATG